MRELQGEYIKKYLKRLNVPLIIGIILCAIGVLFIVFGVSEKKEPEKFTDLLEKYSTEVDKYVYSDINIISNGFATYGENEDSFVCFAISDRYIFIIFLDEETSNAIWDAYQNGKTYRVTGYTKYIDKDLMNLAIEEWNLEETEDNRKLSNANFHNALGYLYLDQTDSGDANFYILAALFLIAGAILLIIHFIFKNNYKKKINNMTDGEFNELNMEINNPESKYYKRNKLLLTPNYLVIFTGSLDFCRYTDILWIWDVKQYYNFVNTGKMLRVFTKNAKQNQIMNCGRLKKQEEEYEEVFNTILRKNPNIRVGFSPDNIKFSNDYKKALKNGTIIN